MLVCTRNILSNLATSFTRISNHGDPKIFINTREFSRMLSHLIGNLQEVQEEFGVVTDEIKEEFQERYERQTPGSLRITKGDAL